MAAGVASTVAALRENELFHKIVQVDPELLLPYLLDRRGRTQDALLALLEAGIREGQRDGSVRDGDPRGPRPGGAARGARLRALGPDDGRRRGARSPPSTPSCAGWWRGTSAP